MDDAAGDIRQDALNSVAERVHDEANKAASAADSNVDNSAESWRQGAPDDVHAVVQPVGDVGDRATVAVNRLPRWVVPVVAMVAAGLGFAAGVISSRRR
ncbi:hypothetical protein [Humibacter sp. RRB41]|uniref:hypothetical protein n=1 Tax=Humibacter sp. RRB41 TaxID=2919946 RepID=UPI001FAB22C8|nr:hypothetical protein [Humibacter sp. RRB41]